MLGMEVVMTLGLAQAGDASAQLARHNAQVQHRAGQALMAQEKLPEAANAFQRAIELDPLLVMAHYNLGQTYMAMKSYPQAVRFKVDPRLKADLQSREASAKN